jgi:DNA (cytosine-5)-methyltransferase 1
MNDLWEYFVQCLRILRPQAFVTENVREFVSSRQFEHYQEELNVLGYSFVYGVLNAYDFGVPQKRHRAFCIGAAGAEPLLPPPTGERTTVRDAIGNLPLEPDGENWHIGRNPTPTSLERYRQVPPGGNRFDLMRKRPDITPQCWLKKKTGTTDVFGRLTWDAPSSTIRTEFFKPEKGRYLHPEAHRPITHREAAALQTFPDDFIFVGSKTQVARQIGEAVPPKLAFEVARSVISVLANAELREER